MSLAPEVPTTLVPRTRVDTDTSVVHQVQHALGAPLSVYLNSMVIAGSEPAIVDTGSINNRNQWLEDVFGIVDPADVRWVFLPHDDSDHTGNLVPVMETCPNATLVCSWALIEWFSNAFGFHLHRCRWLNDGEAWISMTGASSQCGRPSTTHRLPEGSSTSEAASTGESTPSPRPVQATRFRRSPTWIPPFGPRAWPCSSTTPSRRGSGWLTRPVTPLRSIGSERWA
jgi:hypothetical protein